MIASRSLPEACGVLPIARTLERDGCGPGLGHPDPLGGIVLDLVGRLLGIVLGRVERVLGLVLRVVGTGDGAEAEGDGEQGQSEGTAELHGRVLWWRSPSVYPERMLPNRWTADVRQNP